MTSNRPPAAYRLEINDSPSDAEVGFLGRQITEFNFGVTQIGDARELMIRLLDEDGGMAAGLHGWTWGGCLQIVNLWVGEDLRGKGYGSKFLRIAETEAISRGCQLALLDTHDFQAPDFYVKHGYEEVFRIEGCPRGYSKNWLRKHLR